MHRIFLAPLPEDPTTIAENIAYSCPSATHEQICEAARMAGAANFIEALPDQYETALLNSGMNLSGGQRQRIALARALLTRAPILVLDEPTSALDSEHEQIVIETLRSLKAKHTVVLVSHHIGAVMSCDRIYVLDQGLIVEHGSHQELLRQGGIYAAMAKQQSYRVFQFSPKPPRLDRSPAEENSLKILRAKVESRRTLAQSM